MEYVIFFAAAIAIVLIIMLIHSVLLSGAMNGVEALQDKARKKSGKDQKTSPTNLKDRY